MLAQAAAAAVRPTPADQKTVVQIVDQWEKRTLIDVSAPSEQRLQKAIPEVIGRLKLDETAPPAKMNADKYRQFVFEGVTESFLYWTRDQTDKGAKTISVAMDEVRISAFLKYSAAPAGRPVGKLHILSEPTQQPIEVDGQPKGNTENLLVLSEGAHTVVVRRPGSPCTKQVVITAGVIEKMECK